MEWGPEITDAVVTCASPHPVAHPARPDRLTTGCQGGGADLFFICPAGRHQ